MRVMVAVQITRGERMPLYIATLPPPSLLPWARWRAMRESGMRMEATLRFD